MKKNILLLFMCLLAFVVQSQQKDVSGQSLIDYKNLKYISTNKEFGKVTRKEKNSFEITTHKLPKFIYNIASAIPLNNDSFSSGRIFLFSFWAKTTKSSLETGEAKVNVLFRQSKSHKTNIVSTQSLSSNWKKYYIPIKATRNISANDLKLVLHYGFRPQTFLIKDLKFEVFAKGTELSSLPKTEIKYKGMEANAKWRIDALKRIDAIRKGNFKLEFTNNGKSISNKEVKIELVKHAFPFGAAITGKDITQNPKAYLNFKKAFNHVVLANDLKIKSWQWEKKRPKTIRALKMLNTDGYMVKGHVLIWPGFNYLTKEFKENKNNPKKITDIMHNHINDILDVTKGKVSHWDVVNEAYTNNDLQKITGSEEILFEGFRILKKKQPQVKTFTNEYGIISKGGLDTRKQKWYYNFVKRIDSATNGLINGIGIQSHIGSDLTPPEKVIELLGYYATLGKQISISEFTMDILDLKVREQYTKDFMIAALSHPNVSEFLFWGYVKDDRNKVDIFNKDWTIGSMGKAYFSLVHKEWKTQLSKKTDVSGVLKGRGFYGKYQYSFIDEKGKEVTGFFTLKPRNKNSYKIEL